MDKIPKIDRQREHQANERTFLAWLRTSIAFILQEDPRLFKEVEDLSFSQPEDIQFTVASEITVTQAFTKGNSGPSCSCPFTAKSL